MATPTIHGHFKRVSSSNLELEINIYKHSLQVAEWNEALAKQAHESLRKQNESPVKGAFD